MSSARKKPTKSAAKAPARKAATAPKAAPPAPRKKAAKPTARREEPSAPAEPRAPRSRAQSAAAAARAATGTEARSRLGAKWVCFTCGAKFYDLNKPEPLCPKCGANQNLRPKRDPRPKVVVEPPPPPRPVEPERDMLPIEEDEEDALIMEDEEIDLGTPELDGEAEEFADEEEEDPGDA